VIGVPDLLADVKFLQRLFLEDRRVAERLQRQCCPHCGGPLHQAHYPRKVRGVADEAAEFFERRFSFCCGRCRRRQTPPSLRFGGRLVYAMAAVLVSGVMAMRESLAAAARQLGAARRTIGRWLWWFRDALPESQWWKRHAGQFREPPEPERMPLSLLEQIAGATKAQRVLRALRLLRESRFSMAAAFTQRMTNSVFRSAP
jgi:hypothetical protein